VTAPLARSDAVISEPGDCAKSCVRDERQSDQDGPATCWMGLKSCVACSTKSRRT